MGKNIISNKIYPYLEIRRIKDLIIIVDSQYQEWVSSSRPIYSTSTANVDIVDIEYLNLSVVVGKIFQEH